MYNIKSNLREGKELAGDSKNYQHNSAQCSFSDFLDWNSDINRGICEAYNRLSKGNFKQTDSIEMPPINLESVPEQPPAGTLELVSEKFNCNPGRV